MDIITFLVLGGALVALAARFVELLVRHPDAFGQLVDGARPFAEAALAESARLDRPARVGPAGTTHDPAGRPALAA